MYKHQTTQSLRRESPAESEWLLTFLEDNRRRFVVAFAAAIAIHEIIAWMFPWHTTSIPEATVETVTIAKLTRIERRPTPRPSPTPKPVVHTKIIAETHVRPTLVNPGTPSEHQHIRRVASARPLVRTRFHSKPTVHVPMGGHGVGTSKVAKAETGGVGPGGNGTGESGNGNGTGGAPQAQEPCGAVYFEPTGQPTIDQSTGQIWERVSAIVHFPDGSTQNDVLDYPFYYSSRAADPFFPENAQLPALFQPPPASQRASEPAIVQYIMAHSSADGYTKLRDCTSPAP